jgi:hypothetical protein
MTTRTIELTGPTGRVRDTGVSPVAILRAVFAKLAGTRLRDEDLATTHRQVGVLPGDAIEITYDLRVGDIRIAVDEAFGFIQDTFVFTIEAPDDQIDLAATELEQAARDLGLVRRGSPVPSGAS